MNRAGIFYTAHKIAADVVNLFFAWLFPPLSLSLLRSSPPPFSFSSSSSVRAAPFSLGSRGFTARLGRKTLPRAAVLFSFSFVKKPRRTWRGLISKLQAQLGYIHTRLGVFSRGYSPHSAFFPYLGIRNALCNAARFEKSSKQVFALAFCTYPRCCSAYRDDCSDALSVHACFIRSILCNIHISYIFLRT